ncbi:hypothetical protein E4K67_24390 [Desulfosporosinus fructosivorans]|uniref:DUF2878 domain-containing protein n=1 Tax=Desulfosporosinus fructosivorans TaxID=2018669 RepID=A0A4Z0QYT1_9FIRM|nr:hypothetical protein [Desulfosporosinus fructosivorans]TGE35668.1 hypothetical protein E4K67_24390 [Desulfosporosinus fructosivorans]
MLHTLFYPTYILIAFIVVLLTIPQRDLKNYFIYGVLFGGLGDLIVVGLFQNVLHIIWFKNAGIFNILGQNLLSPPSWILTVMIFLRFLPSRKLFQYAYVLGFGAFSVGYGYLVHNVGLFDFKPWVYPLFAYFTFLFWWSTITWVFVKTSSLIRNP